MEAERRQVTVLFTDMVGFTSFSERSGEEAAYTLIRSLSKLMADAVREQGGVVQNFTGDGIMAVFGAPVAFEDAPLRACRAALSILQKLKAANPDLRAKHGVHPQMRIGLNSGTAVVGKVQEGADAGVTVLGDTVNFAARLQALAEPDSIFLSEATHRLVQGMVETTFAGEHQIKGKAEAQKVYLLDAIRSGATRFEAALSRGLSAFVGLAIDVREWKRRGFLRRSQMFPVSWNRAGVPCGSISVRTESDAVVLIFRSQHPGETEWKSTEQRVPILWTACHLGGRRPWFRCTVYSNGQYCGRRVAVLYGAGDLFACRHCYGLGYASQQESPQSRLIRCSRKIRMRLGGGPDLLQPFPKRPRECTSAPTCAFGSVTLLHH